MRSGASGSSGGFHHKVYQWQPCGRHNISSSNLDWIKVLTILPGDHTASTLFLCRSNNRQCRRFSPCEHLRRKVDAVGRDRCDTSTQAGRVSDLPTQQDTMPASLRGVGMQQMYATQGRLCETSLSRWQTEGHQEVSLLSRMLLQSLMW